jgi:hypothetical protein
MVVSSSAERSLAPEGVSPRTALPQFPCRKSGNRALPPDGPEISQPADDKH